MNRIESKTVLVQVVPIEDGREIKWGPSLTEQLGARLDDIRQAIAVGANAVADSLDGLTSAEGWQLGEVSASFGVTLTAEAGVILSKASAGTTFEVTVTYQRDDEHSEKRHDGARANPGGR